MGALRNEALADLYRSAEALVFPSLLGRRHQQEGMGLVPLEAIACGCPVIASRLPAVTEIVQEGKTGLLFAPGDAAGLASCIDRLLADPASAADGLVEARPALAAHYDWSGVSEGYRRLYTELLNR